MPTLAGILAAVLQILVAVKDIGNRVGVNFAAIAESLRSLSGYMKYTLFPGINAVLLEAVASIIESMQGDGTDPPSNLPEIHGDTQTIINNITNISADLGQISNKLELLCNYSPSYMQNYGYCDLGDPVTVSASGFYEIPNADGVLVDVLSVPDSIGAEVAGAYRRYPHLGWIVPIGPQFGFAGDLSYLGPEHHAIPFSGIRQASGAHVFIRPGVTIVLTPYLNILQN